MAIFFPELAVLTGIMTNGFSMIRLVDDSSQRQQIGWAMAALAQQYSAPATAKRLTNLYAELAACRSAKTPTATTASETGTC
jgi:hypothetical protein